MQKGKWSLSNYFHRLFPRRKYKDFLFQRVFQDKKDLLILYNALNAPFAY